jgi:hypothetical protein
MLTEGAHGSSVDGSGVSSSWNHHNDDDDDDDNNNNNNNSHDRSYDAWSEGGRVPGYGSGDDDSQQWDA